MIYKYHTIKSLSLSDANEEIESLKKLLADKELARRNLRQRERGEKQKKWTQTSV